MPKAKRKRNAPKRRAPKKQAKVRRNAKKIKRNARAIAKLVRDTRESFTRQQDIKFDLLRTSVGSANRIGILPIMPLLLDLEGNQGVGDQQWWGSNLDTADNTQGVAPVASYVFDTGDPVWPVSNAVNDVGNVSKLRHNGATVRYTIQCKQPADSLVRPKAVRCWMVVISAKAKIADGLLAARNMLPRQWVASTGGSPPNPGALIEDQDFIFGTGLYNKPVFNTKLWNVHEQRIMDFGYRGPIDPPPPGQDQPQLHPVVTMPTLDPGTMTQSNWYRSGSIKFPAYGNMYEMATQTVENNGNMILQPADMRKEDLRAEKQRFICFFTDGSGLPNVNTGQCQLRVNISMRTNYSVSIGSMLN